jgi:hypothetical protein
LSGVRFNDDLTVDVTTVVTQPFALEVGGGGICCKNSLTTQDVVAPASSSLLWNVTKIFFATDSKAAYMAKGTGDLMTNVERYARCETPKPFWTSSVNDTDHWKADLRLKDS